MAGTSSPGGGARSCEPCAAGQWAPARASVCSACPAGRYGVGASTTARCSGPCAKGRYGVFASQPACSKPCPPGLGWPLPKGSALRDSASKESVCGARCPPGRFNGEGGGMGGCALCAGGKYAVAAGSGYCKACAPGQYSKALDMSFSATAPAHLSSPIGTTRCLPCRKGTHSSIAGAADSSFCRACSPGYFGATAGATLCQPCPPGKFGAARSGCTACAAGMFQQSAGRASCAVCAAGQFAPRGATLCGVCPDGFACVSGAASGRKCPVGSYAPRARGSRHCVLCPAGTYGLGKDVPAAFRKVVTDPAGEARLACSPCPAGQWGAAGASSWRCSGACAPGRWGRVSQVSNMCSGMCATGRFGHGGADSPRCDGACPKGKFAPAGSPQCRPCPKGRFAGKPGAGACRACPAGKHSMQTIDPKSLVVVIFRCFGCPNGKWAAGGDASGSGSTSCVSCPAGTYGYYDGGSAGAEKAKAGAAEPRRFSQSDVCRTCPKGRFGVGGSKTAACSGPCLAGRWGGGGSTTQFCSGACLAGHFGLAAAEAPTCSGSCPAGRWSTASASACTSCSAGRYAAGEATRTRCTACPTGKYAKWSYSGARVCDRCAVGLHPNAPLGAKMCTKNAPTPAPTPVPPTPRPTLAPTAPHYHVCPGVRLAGGGPGAPGMPPTCIVCGRYALCDAQTCKGSGWFHLGLGVKHGAQAQQVGGRPVYRSVHPAPQDEAAAAPHPQASLAWNADGGAAKSGRAAARRGHFFLYFHAKFQQWVVSEELLRPPFFAAARDHAHVPQHARAGAWSLSHGALHTWWDNVPSLRVVCDQAETAGKGAGKAAGTALAAPKSTLPRATGPAPASAPAPTPAPAPVLRVAATAELQGYSKQRFQPVAGLFRAAVAAAIGVPAAAVAVQVEGAGRLGVALRVVVSFDAKSCAASGQCGDAPGPPPAVGFLGGAAFLRVVVSKLQMHDGFLLLAKRDLKFERVTVLSRRAPAAAAPSIAPRAALPVAGHGHDNRSGHGSMLPPPAHTDADTDAASGGAQGKGAAPPPRAAAVMAHLMHSARRAALRVGSNPAFLCVAVLVAGWAFTLCYFCATSKCTPSSSAAKRGDDDNSGVQQQRRTVKLEGALEAEMQRSAHLWRASADADVEDPGAHMVTSMTSEERRALKGGAPVYSPAAVGGWDATAT